MQNRFFLLLIFLVFICSIHFFVIVLDPFQLSDKRFFQVDPFFCLVYYPLLMILIGYVEKTKKVNQYINVLLMPLVTVFITLSFTSLLIEGTAFSIKNVTQLFSTYKNYHIWVLTLFLLLPLIFIKTLWQTGEVNSQPSMSFKRRLNQIKLHVPLTFNQAQLIEGRNFFIQIFMIFFIKSYDYFIRIYHQILNFLFNKHQSYKTKRIMFYKINFWVLLIVFIIFSILFGFPILGTIMARKVLALTGCAPAFDGIPACFNHGFIQSRFGPLSIWLAALATPFVFLFQFADILLVWSFLIIFFGVLAFKKNKDI